MNIFFDIETIPDQRDTTRDRILANISPPGNIKKAESIQSWMEEKAPAAADEKLLKTSLDGLYGKVFCIAAAIEDSEVAIFYGNENLVLSSFFEFVAMHTNNLERTLIGHNILKFDIPFLYHRSVVNHVKPSFNMTGARFNNHEYYDTMQAWAGYGNYVSLDNLCYGLGIPSPKDGIDGSKVWQYVQEGREQEVYDYCKRDVETTREVYNRMTFK